MRLPLPLISPLAVILPSTFKCVVPEPDIKTPLAFGINWIWPCVPSVPIPDSILKLEPIAPFL